MTDATQRPQHRPDPLAPLLELEGVADAAAAAAEAITVVHRHRANLRKWNITGAESALRGARASAWLEGADPALPVGGEVTDPVLAAALRAADPISPEAVEETGRVWRRAPIQVLAKLALISSPTGPSLADAPTDATMSEAGRPVDDATMTAAMKQSRLHVLGEMIGGGTSVPATVLSAVVHGELLTLRPFAHNNGIIARAASRLTTITGGADPRGLGVPEVYWTRHRDEYRAAADSFATGTPDGLRRWILLHLKGLEAGATEARGIADAV